MLFPISVTFKDTAQADYATGSAYFTASGQYLSVPNNSDFAVGTGDFTVEWWQNMLQLPDPAKYYGWPRVFVIDGASPFGVSIEPGGPTSQDNPQVYLYWGGVATKFGTLTGFTNNYKGIWTHFAVIRTGSTIRMFVNGTQLGSDLTSSYNFTDGTTPLSIGNKPSESTLAVFPGYITNFHFVNGTALYTSNFNKDRIPTSPVANSKLLLLHKGSSNFLTDSSGLGKSVTNNGSVQYSSFNPSWWVDAVTPTLSSTSMASNGMSIGLTFTETLSSTTASPSNFSVSLNSSETMTINSVTTSGTVATLNLASLVPAGRTVTVSYTDPTAGDDTNALQDDYGNDVATFTNQSVRNISQSLTDYAYSSDGSSNTHLYTASSAANQIPDTFTAEAWIYPTGLDCKGGGSSNWNNTDVYCHIFGKGNQLSLFLASNTPNPGTPSGTLGFIYGGQVKYSRLTIPLNEWHHIAFSREGSGAGQSKLYLDGNLIFEDTTTANTANTTRHFTVGASRSDGTDTNAVYGKFIGQVDEVRVSKIFRDQNAVQYDMRHHNGDSSNFLLYYDFNQDSGSSLINRATGATSSTDLSAIGSPAFDSTKIFVTDTTTQAAYTIVKFYRDFIVDADGWKSPANISSIRYMAVGGGGGGGGGWNGGGGGAGGYRETNTTISPDTIYNVEIGLGGNGALYKYGPGSGSGSIFRNSSTATTLFSVSGGGRGATEQNMSGGPIQSATNGGSGGGGSHAGGVTAGTGNYGSFTPVEGYDGGAGYSAAGFYVGGGGGGAGGVGTAASTTTPGAGGVGVTTYITGTQLKVGGGGAGAGRLDIGGIRSFSGTGNGSNFGGGSGSATSSSANAIMDTGTAGTANTGGGGGAGSTTSGGEATGGAGGSGFIVIKYINKPVFSKQPVSDTITVGAVETFTVNTTAPVAPVTKSIKWQYSADTTTVVEASISGWTDVSSGTGYTTDTFTTSVVTKSMNKYRYRAIVTLSDTSTITSIETSTIATLTINDSINFTSDTSTITRKYGDTQTVRTITYSGGTSPHTVTTPYGALANGKIYIDTSTSTTYFKVDTGTVIGTYYETITVTDNSGISATYAQKVIVNSADTLTVRADTLTAITYNPNGMTINPTVSYSGLANSDTQSALTLTYTSTTAATCAQGGLCNLGDTGPGGGIIFYETTTTQSWGRYIEAAPIDWYTVAKGGPGSDTFTWCSNSSFAYFNGLSGFELINAIGYGRTNLSNLWTGCDINVTSSAPGFLYSYSVNGKNDWFLPSLTELDALNNYSNGILTQKFYWVAWDTSANVAQTPAYGFGGNAWPYRAIGGANKTDQYSIRPMRYVTPNANLMSYNSTTPPTNAGTYKITPSALVLANNVDTSNYVSINYQSSTFTINKNIQETLTITSKLGSYNGGTTSMQLTTKGGTDTGTVTYAIVSGGSASGCSISTNVLSFTSAGTCKVVATKAATINYLIAYSDTVTITLSAFISHQPVQTQSVPTQLPINGKNSLDTTTATIPDVTSVTSTGAGAYTIVGTGFTGVNRVVIGGSVVTIASSTSTTINITGASGLTGPLIIECSDGRLGPVPFWLIL